MNDDNIKKKIKICRRHYSIITCNGEGKIMWKTLWDRVLKVQLFESSETVCHLEKCWVAECKESKICNRQFQNAEWPPSWSSTWNYPILRIYYLSQGNLALKFANFCPFWYHGRKVRIFFSKRGKIPVFEYLTFKGASSISKYWCQFPWGWEGFTD